ncbi:MAG: branched-chain amino acid ABC transporter permease [Candidatus Bathyarchaeota archaeon]|nr:branched-chain amino acid ABC transporter permease [Candidatus Bathyarchaeota archaeon]
MVNMKNLKENISKRGLIFVIPILLLLFPILTTDYYILTILITANIYAVFASSWDLLGGVTGQFSLGQALFFGVAAYMSGALNLYLGLAPWMTIPLGGAFGVIVGFLVALPSLRLKGAYFAITSLIFPGILATLILMYPDITGGDSGLYGLSSISSEILITYYASLLLMIGSIFVLLRIANSNMGLIFRSIRDDEDAAEATGINTTKYKFYSFAISGFFAGIAGGFQAHLLMFVGPYIFNAFYSFQAILFAALGGIGTIIGSVGGAYLMSILNEVLRDIAEFRVIVTAIVMLLVFRFLPRGLLREITRRLGLPLGFWSGLKKLRRSKDESDS